MQESLQALWNRRGGRTKTIGVIQMSYYNNGIKYEEFNHKPQGLLFTMSKDGY
jgi:hypothetical protein